MALPYEPGLQEAGGGVFAYLQRNGGWGLNHAGLIAHGGRFLLGDILFDRLRAGMTERAGGVVP